MDYIPPRVKLSDDTFVFLDGKWVNETYIQSALASSPDNIQKHSSKKSRNEWTLWEENKALWEENKALRMENRALREENKALQCLRMENKGIQVIYDESLQQVLQQDKQPLEGLQNLGLANTLENKALQVIREENKALQVFRENNIALKIFPDKVFPEKKKPIPLLLQKEKLSVQSLGMEEPAVPETSKSVTAPEISAKAILPQALKTVPDTQEESRSLERNNPSVPLLEENEGYLAVHNLNQMVLSLLRENQALLEEKQASQALQEGNKILWDENNKLKLQHSALKGAIRKMAAELLALEQELSTCEGEREIKKVESC